MHAQEGLVKKHYGAEGVEHLGDRESMSVTRLAGSPTYLQQLDLNRVYVCGLQTSRYWTSYVDRLKENGSSARSALPALLFCRSSVLPVMLICGHRILPAHSTGKGRTTFGTASPGLDALWRHCEL